MTAGPAPTPHPPLVRAGAHRPPDIRCVLRDGTRVVIRPLRADDAPRLAQAFASLTPTSRFRRFLGVVRLGPDQLRYLADVDQRDHLALAALDPATRGTPLVGVVRCIRLPEAPATAELAVTVVDSHQGRGLGTLLLGALVRWLDDRAAGIRAFRGYVDAGNGPALELIEQLGGRIVEREEGTVTFEVPVPAPGEPLPDTPAGRAVRAVGRGDLALTPRRARR